MYKHKGSKVPHLIEPPASILRRQDRAPWTRLYFDPESALPRRSMTWKAFGELCRKAGILREVVGNTTRLLNAGEADRLFDLWPRGRRKQRK